MTSPSPSSSAPPVLPSCLVSTSAANGQRIRDRAAIAWGVWAACGASLLGCVWALRWRARAEGARLHGCTGPELVASLTFFGTERVCVVMPVRAIATWHWWYKVSAAPVDHERGLGMRFSSCVSFVGQLVFPSNFTFRGLRVRGLKRNCLCAVPRARGRRPPARMCFTPTRRHHRQKPTFTLKRTVYDA